MKKCINKYYIFLLFSDVLCMLCRAILERLNIVTERVNKTVSELSYLLCNGAIFTNVATIFPRDFTAK